MTFQHPDIEQHYERVMALSIGGLPEDGHRVFALMDAYGRFRMVDDDQTAMREEIISHLLSPELRPALRSWYRRHRTVNTNVAFNEFRNLLSAIAGESFA